MMLVIFSEALGAGQTFADKHDYRLDPSQEMIALGAANIGSGLLGGLAVRRQPLAVARSTRAPARAREMSPLVAAVLGARHGHRAHPAVHRPARGGAGRADHPRRLAPDEGRGDAPLLPAEPQRVLARCHHARVGDRARRAAGPDHRRRPIDRALVYKASRPQLSVPARPPASRASTSTSCRHPEDGPVPGLLVLRRSAPLLRQRPVRDPSRRSSGARDPTPRAVILDVGVNDEHLDITAPEDLMGLVLGTPLGRD